MSLWRILLPLAFETVDCLKTLNHEFLFLDGVKSSADRIYKAAPDPFECIDNQLLFADRLLEAGTPEAAKLILRRVKDILEKLLSRKLDLAEVGNMFAESPPQP